MSQDTRNEFATERPCSVGVGLRRARRVGMRLDSAPVVETEPISSWLKRAMTETLPVAGGGVEARASTAQKLEVR